MYQYQSYKGREIHFDKPVRIYKNLNNGLFSVQQAGLVVAHVESFTLKNADWDVAEKRRQEVIRSKCKNVHAYLTGLIIGVNVDSVKIDNLHHYIKLSYDPYKHGHFYNVAEESKPFKIPHKGIIWGHVAHGIYYRE